MHLLNLVFLTVVGVTYGANQPTTTRPTTTTAAPKPPLIDSKIVGGTEVSITQFPYQLSLRYYDRFICGASIISNYWFLTAAHCVQEGSSPDSYSVRAGSTYQSYGGVIYYVLRYFVHPQWDSQTFDYDFTVMRVKKPFRYSNSIRSICLSRATPPAGSRVVVSGWGTTSAGGSTSQVLKAANLNMVSTASCNISYSGEISPRMICAAYPDRDSCQGDSGGPLVDRISRCQCGVVSWGESCALPDKPGVYSEITKVRSWIRSTTGV